MPKELPPDQYQLLYRYTGVLTEQPQGLFLSRYATATGEKRALTTQMEATDARRMFPCWDEPVFRATFELTAAAPGKSPPCRTCRADRARWQTAG